MAILSQPADPAEPLHCPRCQWQGAIADSVGKPDDCCMCPECGEPVLVLGVKPSRLTYEQRQEYACDVCGNAPDAWGEIEHGRGCRVVSEDGGGSTWVELPES